MVYTDYFIDDASELIKDFMLKSVESFFKEEEERIKEEREEDSEWELSDEKDFPGYFVMSSGEKLVLKENSANDIVLFGYAVTFLSDGGYFIYIFSISAFDDIIREFLDNKGICYFEDFEVRPSSTTIRIDTRDNCNETIRCFKELLEKIEIMVKTSPEYKKFFDNLGSWTKE